jgi:hypothetical protein
MSSRRRVLLSVLTGVISAAIAGAQGLDASRGVPPAAREAISRAIGSDISIFQEAKLGSTANASLGISVAISGDTLVAGAPYAQPAAAYVFVKPASGWADTTTFAAKLTASDGVTDDGFGSSVAILGDTVVVGATQFNIGSKGAAYVFVKPASGWKSTSAFTAKLTASGGFNSDAFGSQVAISANTIFVGASDARVGANAGQGAVYVFEEPGPAGRRRPRSRRGSPSPAATRTTSSEARSRSRATPSSRGLRASGAASKPDTSSSSRFRDGRVRRPSTRSSPFPIRSGTSDSASPSRSRKTRSSSAPCTPGSVRTTSRARRSCSRNPPRDGRAPRPSTPSSRLPTAIPATTSGLRWRSRVESWPSARPSMPARALFRVPRTCS